MVRACLIALLLGVFCLPAATQVPPPDAPPPPPAGMRGQGRDRREMARLYLIQRMRDTLSLTDAQTLKVMDVLKSIDEERSRHRSAMAELLSRIQTHLENDKTPTAVLAKDVADFRARQAGFEKRLRELEARLLDSLTPRQQARFLLLRRNLMNQMRGGGPGRHFRGPRSGRGAR